MKSNGGRKASPPMAATAIEELKASEKEIHAQYALLGVLISNHDTCISNLETQLRDYYASRGNASFTEKFEDSGSCSSRNPEVEVDVMAEFKSAAAVNLTIVGPDGTRKDFIINTNEKIKVVISNWCSCFHEKPTDFVFVYKGHLLMSDSSPHQAVRNLFFIRPLTQLSCGLIQLHMKDGDEIYAERRW
ncbi:hypothetical protein V2J09_014560 [Rumex salicifolius]